MTKEVKSGEKWLVAETTALSSLIIAPDAELCAPEGKLLTLTVDGVHRDTEPGTYTGNVVLSVTDPVEFSYENYGQMEYYAMNAAVSVRNGKYMENESVTAACISGSVSDTEAKGLVIRSEGDNFGGIYVDGGSYTIDGADIAMNGHGASDAVGYGASIAVRNDGKVTINNTKINNVGSIRTALQVSGHGKVVVNDSEFTAADDDRPNYVKAMSKAPWMLGIHGRVRTTNAQDYAEVEYHRCKIQAQNWGAMSVDGTKKTRLYAYDTELITTDCGYGAFSIADCRDYFDHCTIRAADYGTVQSGSDAMVTYTNGTTVDAGRSAVMQFGSGKPGLLKVDGKSRLHSGGPLFQIKGRGADILVDDAELSSDSGVLMEIIDNDDPNGRGMHLGPETVMDVPPGGWADGGIDDPMLKSEGPEGFPGGAPEGFPGGAPGGFPGGAPGGFPGGAMPEGMPPMGAGGPPAGFPGGEMPGGFPGGAPGGPGGGAPGGADIAHREEKEEVFPVKAVFKNGSYSGDILHAYADKNEAEIIFSNASYSGRITTSVSNHPKGMPLSKELYPLVGRVDHVICPGDHAFDLKVRLEDGASWNVTGVCYLNELTLGAGCSVAGTLTVNGEPAEIGEGTFSGKLVLSPLA